MKGELLVEAGVDACSRATEFKLTTEQFKQLNSSEQFGRRGGFNGFTVDVLVSDRTKQLPVYNYYEQGRNWEKVFRGFQDREIERSGALFCVLTTGDY